MPPSAHPIRSSSRPSMEEDDYNLLLDFPSKPRMLTAERRKASHFLSIRRAITVATGSLNAKLRSAAFSEDYVRFSRQKIQLDQALFECELVFIDLLHEMDDADKISTMFELFDKDDSGTVDVEEIAEGLREMSKLNAIKPCMDHTERTIHYYTKAGGGILDETAFGNMIEQLEYTLNADSFFQLCHLITSQIAFSENGRVVLEKAVQEVMAPSKENKSLEQFDDAIVEARMVLVFGMLDEEHTGIVSFKDVVKHIFHFCKGMDDLRLKILLMVDEKDIRTLDYKEFSELMLCIVASFPDEVSFHEIADSMTLSVAAQDVQDEDLRELMTEACPEKIETIASHSEKRASENDLAYGRMRRLFDLIDLDHNGFIDFGELSLGLHKFETAHSPLGVEQSVSKSEEILRHFDEDHDNRLDREEFANMLTQFSDGADVDLHRLIDFMVVQCALKDDDKKEQHYIETLKAKRREENSGKKGRSISSSSRRMSSFDAIFGSAICHKPSSQHSVMDTTA